MPDSREPDTFRDLLESKSSVIEKVAPDQRRLLNQAIIDRDPPAYKTVYNIYRLRDLST